MKNLRSVEFGKRGHLIEKMEAQCIKGGTTEAPRPKVANVTVVKTIV